MNSLLLTLKGWCRRDDTTPLKVSSSSESSSGVRGVHGHLVVVKNYPPQFKANADALYQSRPEAAIRQIAADLGINPEAPRNRVRAAGASRPRGHRAAVPAAPPTPPEAENAALRRKVREPEEEREILRKAAKCFAGETRW